MIFFLRTAQACLTLDLGWGGGAQDKHQIWGIEMEWWAYSVSHCALELNPSCLCLEGGRLWEAVSGGSGPRNVRSFSLEAGEWFLVHLLVPWGPWRHFSEATATASRTLGPQLTWVQTTGSPASEHK